MEASQQKACLGCVELKGIHLLFEFRFSTFTPLTKIVLIYWAFQISMGLHPSVSFGSVPVKTFFVLSSLSQPCMWQLRRSLT